MQVTAPLLVNLLALMLASSMIQVSPKNQGKLPANLLGRVREAMSTTTESTANITKAYVACDQWNKVMVDKQELPETIRGICFALQASCLARVGKDSEALGFYEACLNLKQFIGKPTLDDAYMGKAFALQRLMRYHDAAQAFLQCDSERACVGAVTCLLRVSDVAQAIDILRYYVSEHPDCLDLTGILATILYTRGETKNELKEASQMLERCRGESPLFQWVYMASRQSLSCAKKFESLELALVNQSPFDEPLLVHLDDKVLLHKLFTDQSNTCSNDMPAFWPKGWVLPRDTAAFEQETSEQSTWVLKQRAGYGSHGNQLVNKQEAIELSKSMSDLYLCQQLVSPPLLIDGYKFSMRLYVLYFAKDVISGGCAAVYLCNHGLVKLASLPYRDDFPGKDDGRVHMTNSGREDQMIQSHLTLLQKEAEAAGWSYNALWNDIREAVRVVMHNFVSFSNERAQTSQTFDTGKLGIPKLLGFDFIVDANRRPFLVEVNRFPGLEPRDSSDSAVKQSVVLGAWGLAGNRTGMDAKEHFIGSVDVEPCSFEQLI